MAKYIENMSQTQCVKIESVRYEHAYDTKKGESIYYLYINDNVWLKTPLNYCIRMYQDIINFLSNSDKTLLRMCLFTDILRNAL